MHCTAPCTEIKIGKVRGRFDLLRAVVVPFYGAVRLFRTHKGRCSILNCSR